jgi:hypothetical protein
MYQMKSMTMMLGNKIMSDLIKKEENFVWNFAFGQILTKTYYKEEEKLYQLNLKMEL